MKQDKIEQESYICNRNQEDYYCENIDQGSTKVDHILIHVDNLRIDCKEEDEVEKEPSKIIEEKT